MEFQRKQILNQSEVTGEFLFGLSPDGLLLSTRPALSRITGWTSSDCIGKTLRNFVHIRDVFRIRKALVKASKGDSTSLEDVRFLQQCGQYSYLHLSFIPRFFDGRLIEIICLGLESSQPGLANSITPEQSQIIQFLETLLANSPVGFCFLDTELRYVCVNESFASMNGFAPDQHLGKTIREITPEQALLLEPVFQKVLETGEPRLNVEIRFHFARNNNGIEHGLGNFYAVRGSDGRVVGVGGMVSDFTEHKRSDQTIRKLVLDLKRSNEELERFGAIASHDLREPLRTISLFVSLFKINNEMSLDRESLEHLSLISEGTQRMTVLIEDLIRFSKLGAVRPEKKLVDLNTIMEQTLFNLTVAIEESHAVITYDPMPSIEGDSGQLLQLFQNLFANAMKFAKKKVAPKIHVSLTIEPTEFHFSVKDNGIGFKPEDAQQIFEVFRQLHKKSEYSGSGLGLATCKAVVTAHKGRIWAESKLGKGSTFHFTLARKASETHDSKT